MKKNKKDMQSFPSVLHPAPKQSSTRRLRFRDSHIDHGISIRRRESKQSVVVVLEGIKVCGKTSTGLLPLKRVMRDVVNRDDEILVLALLQVEPPPDEVNRCNGGSCNTDPYTSFLQQEISQKNDIYKKIFRHFYHTCKHKGVKFQVKTAAGFHLKDLVLEEANNTKATWIVMDSCFARHFTFRMSGTNYIVSLVSDDEEAMIDNCLLKINGSEISIIEDMDCNPRSPMLIRGLTSKCEHCYNSPPPASTSKEIGHNKTLSEPFAESKVSGKVNAPQEEISLQETFVDVPKKLDEARILLGQPLQFSWEAIQNITGRFQYNISWLQGKNFESFMGHLPDADSFVMVQRFSGDWCHILEAEKKAALSLHHKNILTLIGYHKSKDHMFLVFPHQSQKTLDKYLFDSPWRRKELSFQQRMQVAIGTAQGLRYMHQECRHGPILHGELLPITIFLNHNFQPMISGFEYAKWLGREQEEASTSNSRYEIGDSLHQRSMTLIKTDVLAFGVLLLRLFCKRSIPPDDRILLDMARPLLLQRAFHELLDEEESEDSDVHAIYRVMTAASLCTKKRPSSRPLMSEVVPILKGEIFCSGLSSPSDNSS